MSTFSLSESDMSFNDIKVPIVLPEKRYFKEDYFLEDITGLPKVLVNLVIGLVSKCYLCENSTNSLTNCLCEKHIIPETKCSVHVGEALDWRCQECNVTTVHIDAFIAEISIMYNKTRQKSYEYTFCNTLDVPVKVVSGRGGMKEEHLIVTPGQTVKFIKPETVQLDRELLYNQIAVYPYNPSKKHNKDKFTKAFAVCNFFDAFISEIRGQPYKLIASKGGPRHRRRLKKIYDVGTIISSRGNPFHFTLIPTITKTHYTYEPGNYRYFALQAPVG